MNTLERFTRDRVSRFIWGGVTVVLVIVTAFVWNQGASELRLAEQAARQKAENYTNTVLYRALDEQLVSEPILGQNYRDLLIDVVGGIMVDDDVARVRIYRVDGQLIFSTDEREDVGLVNAGDDPNVQAALAGRTADAVASTSVGANAGSSSTTTQVLASFVPLHTRDRIAVVGAVEIDQYYANIAGSVREPWATLRWVSAIAAAACFVLLALSMRTPVAAIGAGSGRDSGDGGAHEQGRSETKRETERLARAEAAAASAATELKEARDQLGMAEDSYRRLDAKLKEAQSKIAESQQPPADARVAELEEALREAEAELALASASLEEATAVSESDTSVVSTTLDPQILDELEHRIQMAEDRARTAEEQVRHLLAPGDPPPPTPSADAADLRQRLAKTAAKKKLHGGE